MRRFLKFFGLLLLIPGLVALGVSLYQGPLAWNTDHKTFWGMPISLFVFWIGLAHAGTLISAIFLSLGIGLDRRTSLLAELSTLCCLAVAGIYPLMHLGLPERFYMLIPLLDARSVFPNLRSPLVWDFCCIAIYGILSALFFCTHLVSGSAELGKIRKCLAWLLFPLVLWVHTVVSLDFACTFVPEWRGAYFPLYFICGAIYSGVALVNLILVVENYRVRILERLIPVLSFAMVLFWVWDYALKGTWSMAAFVFAGILPQFIWVEAVRESRCGRTLLMLSVLLGLFMERVELVFTRALENLRLVDIGLVCFGFGLFIELFLLSRTKLSKWIENDEIVMGDVEFVQKDSSEDSVYYPPFSTPEFKILRKPLLMGLLVCLLFLLWGVYQNSRCGIETLLVNVLPITLPLIVLVAGILVCIKYFKEFFTPKVRSLFVIMAVVLGGALGAFYGGGDSNPGESGVVVSAESFGMGSKGSDVPAEFLWNARCASCHGTDGRFNEKFVREFYPMPQKLSLVRMDSLGEDSLTQVILEGRVNMSAYGQRLSEPEARGLVRYMRRLAEENER